MILDRKTKGTSMLPLAVCGVGIGMIAALPLVYDDLFLFNIIVIASNLALFALSFDIIAGFVGQLNLGQSIFYGIGAYTVGFVTMYWDVSGVVVIVLAGIAAVLVSLLVGIPCLRLKGPYYAIATLAFSQVLFTLAIGLPKITGAEEGISSIPVFIEGILGNYYFSLGLLSLFVIGADLLFRTRFGKKLISIREDEVLSEFAGINVSKYKIMGSAISAFMAGVAGAHNCYYVVIASPDSLSIGLTFSVVAIVVFGGFGTIYGPVVGAFLLTFVTQYLYFVHEYRLLIYGALIMAIVLYFPKGMMGLVRQGISLSGFAYSTSEEKL